MEFLLVVYIHGSRNHLMQAFLDAFGRPEPGAYVSAIIILRQPTHDALTRRGSQLEISENPNEVIRDEAVTVAYELHYVTNRHSAWGRPLPKCPIVTCPGHSHGMDAIPKVKNLRSELQFKCSFCKRHIRGWMKHPDWIFQAERCPAAFYWQYPLSSSQLKELDALVAAAELIEPVRRDA